MSDKIGQILENNNKYNNKSTRKYYPIILNPIHLKTLE